MLGPLTPPSRLAPGGEVGEEVLTRRWPRENGYPDEYTRDFHRGVCVILVRDVAVYGAIVGSCPIPRVVVVEY
jgi:hypothetical protein